MSAVTDLREALALKPEHYSAWELMSEIYFQLGQYQDALECLRQAGKCPESKRQRHEFEVRLRSVEKLANRSNTTDLLSVRSLQKWINGPGVPFPPVGALVKSEPSDSSGNPSDIVKEAKKAESESNYQLATELYSKALEKTPEDPQCHYDLAVTYEINGKIAKAMSHYERAIELKSNDIEAMLALGDLHAITLNDGKKALYWYALAIKTESDPSKKRMIADRMKRFLIYK